MVVNALLAVALGLAGVFPPAAAALAIFVSDVAVLRLEVFTLLQFSLLQLVGFSACVVSAVRVAGSERRVNARSTWMVLALAFGISAWSGFSALLQVGPKGAVMALTSGNLPYLAVVFAYWRNRRARSLFFLLVLAQLLIATGVILAAPGFSRLDATSVRIDPFLSETAVDVPALLTGDYRKLSGQFYNPLGLSEWAGTGLLLGVILAKRGRPAGLALRGLGWAMILLSVWLLGNAMMRGVLLGLAVGGLIAVWRAGRLRTGAVVPLVLLAITLAAIAGGAIDSLGNVPILQKFVEVADPNKEQYRLTNFWVSLDSVARRPLLGTGSYYLAVDELGGLAHQLPLSTGVLYGVPAGLGVGVFCWLGLFPSRVRATTARAVNGGAGAIPAWLGDVAGVLFFVITLTNGSAASGLEYLWLGLSLAVVEGTFRPARGGSVIAGASDSAASLRSEPVN